MAQVRGNVFQRHPVGNIRKLRQQCQVALLEAKGYFVTAVQNLLTSLADDVAAFIEAAAKKTPVK